jgi:hypothetical protein
MRISRIGTEEHPQLEIRISGLDMLECSEDPAAWIASVKEQLGRYGVDWQDCNFEQSPYADERVCVVALNHVQDPES